MITYHQLSAPASNSNTSALEAAPELKHENGSDRDIRQPHTHWNICHKKQIQFSLRIHFK